MATIRNRSRNYGTVNGVFQNNAGSSNRSASLGYKNMTDVIGNRGGENALTIDESVTNFTPFNYQRSVPGNPLYVKFTDFPLTHFTIGNGHLTVSETIPTSPQLAAMARTNPGKPSLSLPVAIAELKDLPRTLKTIGDLFIAKKNPLRHPAGWGDGFVTWQFGIAPLVSDLKKALDFQTLVERRMKELNALYNGKGLRKRVTLSEGSSSQVANNYNLNTDLSLVVRCTLKTTTTKKMWAVTKWKPTTPPPMGDKEMMKLAKRLVLGINGLPTLEDAWNLMPWSWLVDYFINVGDLFGAMRNSLPATCSSIAVMYQQDTKQGGTDFVFNSTQYGTLNPVFHKSRCQKSRVIGFSGNPPGTGGLQILGARQLSILGALALSRSKRL